MGLHVCRRTYATTLAEHGVNAEVIRRLKGDTAIGHNRYATTGGTVLRNVQPMFAELSSGGFAICHNGNLTNAMSLRREMIKDGAIFHSSSDTEVILQLVAQSRKARHDSQRFAMLGSLCDFAFHDYPLVRLALINSRLRRAMFFTSIPLGQATAHSYSFEQLPKPSSSILFTMFLTRSARSG